MPSPLMKCDKLLNFSARFFPNDVYFLNITSFESFFLEFKTSTKFYVEEVLKKKLLRSFLIFGQYL